MHWYIEKPTGLLIKSDLDVNFSFMLFFFFILTVVLYHILYQ